MSVLYMTLKIWWWGSSNFGAFGNVEYLFFTIALWSILTQSGSTGYGPTYEPNRTVWHLKWVETTDLNCTELFEIEQFDHSPMRKQMTDV